MTDKQIHIMEQQEQTYNIALHDFICQVESNMKEIAKNVKEIEEVKKYIENKFDVDLTEDLEDMIKEALV